MSKTFDFISKCGTFFITTVENNEPKCRPFGVIGEYDGLLYIATGLKKDVYRQLKNNSNVQIVAIIPNQRDWIRVSGIVSEVEDLEDKEKFLSDYSRLQKHYSSANDENFRVFAIRITSSILSLTTGKEILV